MNREDERPPGIPAGQALREHLARAEQGQGRWFTASDVPDEAVFWCDMGESRWGCTWCDAIAWPDGPSA